ncbi:Aste57867_15865 [Aphanomyces stellatus]|uniref:HECT-type E3 ubiquitin transferase n=1 Tax=Aphanomyces stellatus TaxID=120398 RepID=A0A485L796_9STRA|nr:hypothetical protein As57867_015809 [Aphanomyces stellatus]VFT92652.1 Aste57867_15865 [Aphanomyces stellatus]
MKASGAEKERRQTSVLSEMLQDDKNSPDTRSQRILGELAALCSDRDFVLSADSLQFLTTAGKAEGIKLTPEKPTASTSSSSGKKEDARISSDSARRQRVEELTRFFMEAKSDIEFALSGGGRRERPSARDLDMNEEDRDMMDSDSSSVPADDKPDDVVAPPPPPPPLTAELPPPPTIPHHFQLLEDAVDPRVFHPLLSAIRETDPLLYGTIVCHPLVTGQELAKKVNDKKSKKKKKGNISAAPSSTGSSKAAKPESSMYTPDFSLPPLTPDETALNLARFIARAVADRSIQALLLVIKVISAFAWSSLQVPVRSHLQILGGHAPPPPPPPTVKEERSPTESSMDFMSSVMELEGQLDPLVALRSRLGRFEEKNAMEDEEDRLVDQMSLGMPLDEGVDEEVLMARAIALSLSPEVGLKEPPAATDEQPPPLAAEEKQTAAPFTPEEIWHVFDPLPELVDGAMIVQYCLGAILIDCKSYLASCGRHVLPANCPIVPHPLTFLLLHSHLIHLHQPPSPLSEVELVVVACGQIILLHLLELQLFHVDVVGTVPASVGLGQSVSHPNPLPMALKSVVEEYIAPPPASTNSHPLVQQYLDRVHEQALVTWTRGVAHFYPQHADRHRLLLSLLEQCSDAHQASESKWYQLDLLCTRLALPDLSQPFVPLRTPDLSRIDDSLLQSSSSKPTLSWSPATIRDALTRGTCTLQAVYDFCQLFAPDRPSLTTAELNVDSVGDLFQHVYDKEQAVTQHIWNQLPPLVDALIRHVRHRCVAVPAAYAHAPFVAATPDNPRLLLLRSLQDGMLQCLHGAGGDTPTSLEFDPSRCADTLTLVENNQSAKQHTAKQWGMVISTYGCAPNTGLHEWAVRLDRCEKGHVFLGVCTREASVSTYVGGDRQGWGLIGTRALWHNRSKVRGDYGDGFSTGSTVRIRLNTDTGALSFGLLDEDSDWGVAFDGLTQYGTLYPAIGLYQRDDQVTIVPVHVKKSSPPTPASPSSSSSAALSQPPVSPSIALDKELVFQTFLNYVHKVLEVEHLSVPLLSAMAQMKPLWRMQFAWHLLPACMELAKRLDKELTSSWQLGIGGTWELKSSAAGNIPAQQYVLQLTQNDQGELSGQSVSNNAVSLQGTIRGTKVSFLETWMQGGTCLVTGRVRVDGKKFAGTYEDTKSHTSGSIVGECTTKLEPPAMRNVLHMVVCTLIGAYASCFLVHDAAPALLETSTVDHDENENSPDASVEEYDEWINSRLLAGGLPLVDISRHLQGVALKYQPTTWFQAVLPTPLGSDPEVSNAFMHDMISGRNEVDAYVTKHAGESAFVRLGGEAMKTAKRTVLAAMLWHTQVETIDASQEDVRPSENILHVWRTAHRVIEWGIRMKNSNSMTYASVAALITRRARFLLQLQPVRGQVLPERAFSEILMLVSRFIEATSVQLKRLEALLLRNCSRAYFRMIGLNCMRVVVEMGLQKSSGLCAVLQWLCVDSVEEISAAPKHGHYLDALGGAGTALHRQVRDSWEQLYGHLAALLSRSTWAKDYEVQLVVLQAWGVLITPEDHAFISRVGIFRILQTVLDEVRTSDGPKPIVQAALKVVHLLAAQVATSSHEETSDIDSNGAIPLVRQPSGPETLGKSVFNMLYTELNTAHQEEMGPQQYCYQICSLLYSVSGASICRQHLSTGRWLRLLLQLVERGTFSIQQRVLQLLRRLLPYISPINLHIQAPDDECMGEEDESSRNAPQLVAFFLDLLGRLIPPQDGEQPGPSLKLHNGCGLEVVLLLRSLFQSSEWSNILQQVFLQALSELTGSSDFQAQTRALSVLCVLGGHIEGLQVGMAIQILPRSSSSSQEAMFRGAKGVLVALDVEKVAAEVLLQKSGSGSAELTLSTHRPIRVPLDDIVALPDVECKVSDISQEVLVQLVQGSLPQFLSSILDDKSELINLMVSLVGFRALGSLVQQGDLLEWLSASVVALFQVATIQTQSMSDIGLLEEQWVQLYKKWYDAQCPTTEKESADSASASLAPPSAMCQQMMEMGFPREWCEVALQKCAFQVEAAINFCFEHSSDMDRLVKQPNATASASSASAPSSAQPASKRPDVSPVLLDQLSEMGFPVTWCRKALIANRNNVDAALTWILSNGEALEAEDRREEEKKEADPHSPIVQSTIPQGPNPLRAVSGQATINDDMLVEGSAGGGFASVGAPDCIAHNGKWYYEATLYTSGCIQIGWADAAFSGASERGDGVGDGPHSWAYDGWRQMKWHGNSSPYGLKWKSGDVIGCGVDCDSGIMFFTLNGQFMGMAFQGVEFAGGLYPCASFNRRERLTFNLGGLPFQYPIEGFSPVLHSIWTPSEPLLSYEKGQYEDCLEEYVGEEYFDCRYFAKDIKPSAGSRLKPLVDPVLDFAALTRALAILHCRKMLFLILAASPKNLLDAVPPELVTLFLKLVASYTTSTSVADIFKPVVVESLSPALQDTLVQCIGQQIQLAASRKYAKVPWDSSVESLISNQLMTLQEDAMVWNDSHVLLHPNVGLAEFCTGLLAVKHPGPLIQAWSHALKSPSMSLKEKSYRILSELIQRVPAAELSSFPIARLQALTCARLSKEYINFPVVSKYMQSLMELTATLYVVAPVPNTSLQPRIAQSIQIQEALQQLPYMVNPAPVQSEDDDMSTEDRNAPPLSTVVVASPPTNPPVDMSLLSPVQQDILLAAQHGFKVQAREWPHGFEMGVLSDETSQFWSGQLMHSLQPTPPPAPTEEPPPPPLTIGCKVTRGPNWKWRDQDGGPGSIGTVEGISPWSGIEGEGMSVRWPNDALYTYRWGADGQYDLVHVEVDGENLIVHTYPTPNLQPSSKQQVQLGVIFRLHQTDANGISGVVEYPDMNAVVAVVGRMEQNVIHLIEIGLVQGDVDMGWVVKFGCDRWIPGSKYQLVQEEAKLHGEYNHTMWQSDTKTWVPIQGQVLVQNHHLFVVDKQAAFSTLTVSDDALTVQCTSGEARNLALGTVGFSSGIHYWEIRVDQAEFGSVFLGVCEKHTKGQASLNLNRWQGWGFVNFRATYHNSTERIYGDHFNAGDTIGVCLNMESGKLSFFMDGIKYGEHIVTDLGVAFDGLKTDRQVKTLYPCIGLRKAGDKVTLNGKWVSQPGLPPSLLCQDNMELHSILHAWSDEKPLSASFMQACYTFYCRWRTKRYLRVAIRAKGVTIDVDTSVGRCMQVCANSTTVLVAGDRVRILSKGGRALDAPEEAIVLGVYRNQLWYRVETQGTEGSEEGRGYAWYWDANELPELVLVKRNGVEIQATTTIPTPEVTPEQTPPISWQSFCELSKGTLATDIQLVDQINTLCADVGVDVINLPHTAVDTTIQPRVAVLMVLNQKVLHSLPLVRFDDHGIQALRRLTFTSTKLSFWDATLKATATPTPLPSDEYEDPREIRILRINRIQAQASKLALCPSPSDRLRKSVFGQLYREMRTWSDSGFRRAYIGKGHGGQKRAFKVKFLGEGVNDYGGPYRAVFEQIVDELQMDQVEITKGEQGLLPLLVPCPNRRSGTGSNQDKFVLNPSCGTISVAVGPIALELHRFLGKLIGAAVRHGLQIGLDLPSVVWRPLVGLPLTRHHLEDIDVVAYNTLTQMEKMEASAESDEYCKQFTFSTHLSDGTEVPLRVDGESQHVDYASRQEYVNLSFKKRLVESGPQLLALREGLSSVIPMEIAGLFTAKELETLICGRRQVDVSLLKQCTEYEEVDPNSPHIVAFWEVLEEMSADERTLFLRFVWARSRMPNSAKDFPMNFKIQAPHDQGARSQPDQYLPHAQTCFFSLSLPTYSTKDILREKLLYAIENSPNMDADVRLHNAEGWADA